MDGAVVNPLPASVLRDVGVGTVIASNVAGQELAVPARGRAPHLVQTMARMITSMERELIKTQAPLVDVMIRPVVKAQNSFDFSAIDKFVAEGVRAARDVLDGLSPAEWARLTPQRVPADGGGSTGDGAVVTLPPGEDAVIVLDGDAPTTVSPATGTPSTGSGGRVSPTR
jgi:predicted acylesterase/phospholipase RssA